MSVRLPRSGKPHIYQARGWWRVNAEYRTLGMDGESTPFVYAAHVMFAEACFSAHGLRRR